MIINYCGFSVWSLCILYIYLHSKMCLNCTIHHFVLTIAWRTNCKCQLIFTTISYLYTTLSALSQFFIKFCIIKIWFSPLVSTYPPWEFPVPICQALISRLYTEYYRRLGSVAKCDFVSLRIGVVFDFISKPLTNLFLTFQIFWKVLNNFVSRGFRMYGTSSFNLL